MKLSVYSLKNILFQGNAELLNCKTLSGEITILDNHEPYIGVLVGGVMKVVGKTSGPRHSAELSRSPQGGEHFFPVKSGFLQVRKDNEVRCIIEQN